jgi:hypothetical protein
VLRNRLFVKTVYAIMQNRYGKRKQSDDPIGVVRAWRMPRLTGWIKATKNSHYTLTRIKAMRPWSEAIEVEVTLVLAHCTMRCQFHLQFLRNMNIGEEIRENAGYVFMFVAVLRLIAE